MRQVTDYAEEMAMEKKRKTFSPDEKVRILRRHFVEKAPVSDLCDEHGMHPTAFYRWQKEFFENGAAAFERRRNGRSSKDEEKIGKLEAKLAHKDEVIAEIMADHVKLKKSLGEA